MSDEKFNLKELENLEKCLGKKLDYVRFSFADLNGIPRGLSIPRKRVEEVLKNGFSLFMGNMTLGPRGDMTYTKENLDLRYANCNFFAAPNTLKYLKWAGNRSKTKTNTNKRLIGQVLCETAWISPYRNGAAMEACPRYVLRRQLCHLSKLGFTFRSAFEVEFTVYDESTLQPVFSGLDGVSMHVLSKFEDYLYDLDESLQSIGIDTATIIVEHGLGQFELSLDILDGVKSADALFLGKQAIKEISRERGYLASFMSKMSKLSSPNGLHLNMSLWKKQSDGSLENAFYDSSDKHGLSQLHRHWIAGLIRHGKALCALYSPTYNCYRRLHKFMSPDKITWGVDDRTAPFRAKTGGPSSTYCECRIPSGASNPYLVIAGTIVAGIDGIVNKLELPTPITDVILKNDIEKDIIRQQDTKDVKFFPYTLSEALRELENDEYMRNALGKEFVRWFVQLKEELEINVLDNLNEDDKWLKERELYFELI